MAQLQGSQKLVYLRLVLLGLAYVLSSVFIAQYFLSHHTIPTIWPASGLALSALLLWGKRYWPVVFVAAFVADLCVYSSLIHAVLVAVGATAQALFARFCLLRVVGGEAINLTPRSYFLLFIFSLISALVGTLFSFSSQVFFSDWSRPDLLHSIDNWWQGNVLGMILVTPLVLVWRKWPEQGWQEYRMPELLLCFITVFILGQVIFSGWFSSTLGHYTKGSYVYVLIVWAALRFGVHGALLVIAMLVLEAFFGMELGVAFYRTDDFASSINNFWIYSMVSTLVGMTLALAISTRNKALQSLQDEKNKLAAIIDSSMDAIVQMDTNGIISGWNVQAQAMFGWQTEEVLGKSMGEVIVPAQFREAHHAGLKRFLDTGAGPVMNTHLELKALRRDGSEFPIEMYIAPIKTAGRLEFNGFIRDITLRKGYEAKIQRQNKVYAALSQTNQAIVRMQDQSELFPMICQCAVEHGGMKMAWVGMKHEHSDVITAVASHGHGLAYLDEVDISADGTKSTGQGPVGTAYREKHTVVVNDFAQNPITAHWSKYIRLYGWGAVAAFPILRAGNPYAVFAVYGDVQDAFDEQTIVLLEEMAGDVSFAIDNFDRESQRKAAEESLRLAGSIYASSSEGMVVVDAQNHIIAINPAFTEITGYVLQEVEGLDPKILKSSRHDAAFFQAMWAEILHSGRWQGEIWCRRKNGEVYAEWLIINTIYNEDQSVFRRVGLFSDITARKESDDLIWRQANFDQLTGLPNRRMFYDRLEQEIKHAQRTNEPLALMFLDLDRFKEINDALGHDMGDVLLQQVTARLISCVREADTVARLGGDEFTIILRNLGDTDSLSRIAQTIVQKITEPFVLEMETTYISVSIGITLYPSHAAEIEALIKNADQAMYAAKSEGRNRYNYFTPAMQNAVKTRMRLANDLRMALENNEFYLQYQPIVELATGCVRKAEALLRWQHKTLGIVSPAEFIPVAEDTGLIIEIGDWVFRQAMQQVSVWRERFHPSFQISVNKSPVQFRSENASHDEWIAYLHKLLLSGDSLVIEITEGLLMDNRPVISEKMLQFRDAGIQVSLDDFGTGYSSLSYLKKFDIDYLKIDQSFVRNLASGSEDMALCEAIIVMAHKLGIKVIAEGIETVEQRDLLAAADCDYGQGYLYSRPLLPQDFEALLISAMLN
jgi:diguanylate cyclase (GGDEF)-like protein/PAS domain S-box-containing protein